MTLAAPISANTLPLADWTQAVERSVLRQMVALVARPGILSFAGGLPAPELFPLADYAAAMQQALTDPLALQYRPPLPALKEHIVGIMARRGVECRAEQVFITTGAQQALDVLTRLLLNPGGQVMLEGIVYSGIQQVVAPLQPEILSVGTDLATGIDVDAVADHLANGARPAYLYTIPESHNPLGVSISPAKRARLAELARQYNLPIIEDDPYGFLNYDGAAPPPLYTQAPDHVIYVGSFSKILAPALRLGWMIVPPVLIDRLTVTKEACDLESSALTQRAVSAYLDAGHLPGHIAQLRAAYGARRDAMLAALDGHFPAAARWTKPAGGMFIWVELPEYVDTKALLHTCLADVQVAFVPGYAFARPDVPAANCLRLNFSNTPVEKIAPGIQKLASVLTEII